MPVLTFGFIDERFNFGLGGDSRMVRARDPKSFFSAHSGVPHQDVFDCEHRRMAHVQGTGHVRRGKDYGENAIFFFGEADFFALFGSKKPRFFPKVINLPFGSYRIVFGVHFVGHRLDNKRIFR